MVSTNNKIFKIEWDRAIELMFIADSVYEELWFCKYSLVSSDMRKDEWAIIAPYFDKNKYRAKEVISLLKWEDPEKIYNKAKLDIIRDAIIHVQSPIVIARENYWVYRFTYDLWEHLWKPPIDLTDIYFAVVDAYSTYWIWNIDFDIEKFK